MRDDIAALIPRTTCDGAGGGLKAAPPKEYKAESAGDCGGALCFRARMPMGVSFPLLRLVEGREEVVEEAQWPPPSISMLPGGGPPPSISISTEFTEHRRLILGEDSSRLCVPGIWKEGGGGGTKGASKGGGGAMEEEEEEASSYSCCRCCRLT